MIMQKINAENGRICHYHRKILDAQFGEGCGSCESTCQDKLSMSSLSLYYSILLCIYVTFSNQLYLYFYDLISLFSTHASYTPQQSNHHHITTK
jgi:hypothetical protein